MAGVCLVVTSPLNAQISQGGTPMAQERSLSLEEIPVSALASFDLESVMLEDAEDEKSGNYPKIGRVRPIDVSPAEFGEWTELEDGGRLWRAGVKSRDALGLSLQFDDFNLPNGAKMFVYSPDYQHVIGGFTSFNNHESGIFSTQLIPSDEVIVEYYEPTPTQAVPFRLSGVVHAYRMVPGAEPVSREFGASDPCQVNVNCSEGVDWQDEKRGVARIFVIDGSFAGWCTGSLVNNTAEDCTPYLLTALHCGLTASTANLNQWVFHFNYESSGCSNGISSQVPNNTISGCAKIADSGDGGGNNGSDYMLVEINNDIPDSYNPYFNGWRRDNVTSSSGVSIHHPSGDIKKISTYSGNLQSTSWGGPFGTHWMVQWSSSANGHGVTEGGSSGSPIFDNQGLIIGTLTGGSSFCDATSSPDLYGKMSYHWSSNPGDNLSEFLDPTNSGVTSLAGTNQPCGSSSEGCTAEIPYLETDPCVVTVVADDIDCCEVVWDLDCQNAYDACNGGGEDNDNCADATSVTPGIHSFTTVDATTDGPDQPGSDCEQFQQTNVNNDIWYEFTATCDGAASLSTCGTADFDTRIAVYPGGQCPPTAASLIECNDDFGDCEGYTSYLEWEVTEGSTYLLRIGGYDDTESGTGTFELTEDCGGTTGECTVVAPYPEDDACVITVMSEDDYCCNTGWDDVCQDLYDDCNGGGVDCEAGEVSVSLSQNICPDETGTFDATGIVIPDGGFYAVQFLPDGGTGGNEVGFSITGIEALPFDFDADINGVMSGEGFPPLSGQWTAIGIVYSDPEDFQNSVCSSTAVGVALNFLEADDPACDGTGVDCVAEIPFPDTDPCVLVVVAEDEYCCDTEWDEVCQDAYDVCMGVGIECEAGEVSVSLAQDICPDETGIFDATGVVIPEGGGYAVQFVPDGGAGGVAAGFSITGIEPLPFEFDAGINGIMEANELLPLSGQWLVSGFTYTNPDSAAATFCSMTEQEIVLNFLTEDDPACSEGAGNVESFEGDFPPPCWTTADVDVDGQNWFQYGSVDPESDLYDVAQDGFYAAASASWNQAPLTPDNYLATPQLILGSDEELVYWVSGQDPEWSAEHYGVYLSTTGNQPADFTVNLFEETLSDDTWILRMVDLSAYAGQEVYIAFRHFNVTDQFYIKLDNVTLPGEIIPCDETPEDWCSEYALGLWPNINDTFGGAPVNDGTGCPFNEIDAFEVWMSEAYALDNVVEGTSYTFSHCNGPGAGTWIPEYTIIAPSGAVDAYGAGDGDGCSITWTASESGTYLIVINEAGNCGVGAEVENGYPAITCNDNVTGIEENGNEAFNIFPNPNTGTFTITYQGEGGLADIEVLEVSGKVIQRTHVNFSNEAMLPVDLGNSATGMYFIRVTINDTVSIQKVMVH